MVNAFAIHGPRSARSRTRSTADRREAPARRDRRADASDFGVAIVADEVLAGARRGGRSSTSTWDQGRRSPGLDTAKLQTAMRDVPTTARPSRATDGHAAARDRPAPRSKVEAIYEAPYVAHATMEPQNATVSRRPATRPRCGRRRRAPTIVQACVGRTRSASLRRRHRPRQLARRRLRPARDGRRRARRPRMISQAREAPGQADVDARERHDAGVVPARLRREGRRRRRATARSRASRMRVLSQSIALSRRRSVRRDPARRCRGRCIDMISGAALSIFSSGSFGDPFSTEGIQNTPYQFDELPARRRAGADEAAGRVVALGRQLGHRLRHGELRRRARASPRSRIRSRCGARCCRAELARSARRSMRSRSSRAGRRRRRKGIGRGMARHRAFETEVARGRRGRARERPDPREKVYCVVDCGIAVNPDVIRAQMEGGIIFGLSAALDQEITLVDGVVQQRNFDTFPLAPHARGAGDHRRDPRRARQADRRRRAGPAADRTRGRERGVRRSPACGCGGCRSSARGTSEVRREVRCSLILLRRRDRARRRRAAAMPTRSPPARRHFLDVAKVLQSPRCMNCHPSGDRAAAGRRRPHRTRRTSRASRSPPASRARRATRPATPRRSASSDGPPGAPAGTCRPPRCRWCSRARRRPRSASR